MNSKLIKLYQQMYEHTKDECKNCRCPLSCCSKEYCELAIQMAKEDNLDLTLQIQPIKNVKGLLFMSDKGCVLAPHLRPLCTLHTCSINSLGFKPNDERWTKKYFEIREQIDMLELKRTEI